MNDADELVKVYRLDEATLCDVAALATAPISPMLGSARSNYEIQGEAILHAECREFLLSKRLYG